MKKQPKPASARQRIVACLQRLAPGSLVQYPLFAALDIAPGTVAVTLSRLRREGVVQLVSKGTYRLPLTSRFGPVPVSEQQVLQALLQTPGQQLRGYPTGVAAFNQLGLTTQVTQELEIATPRPGRPRQIGNVRVRFVQSWVKVKATDIGLCQLLDALRCIKRLPDASPATALPRLREQVQLLPATDKAKLVRLAQRYNPATRALLGLLLANMGEKKLAAKLKASLNPLTTYKLNLPAWALPNREQWRIT